MEKDTGEKFTALICSGESDMRKEIADRLAAAGRFTVFEAENPHDVFPEQIKRKPEVMIADIDMLRSFPHGFAEKCRENDRYCMPVLYCRKKDIPALSDAELFGVFIVSADEDNTEKQDYAALLRELERRRQAAEEMKLLKLENDSFRSVGILKELTEASEKELSDAARRFRAEQFNGRYVTLILILAQDTSLTDAESRIMKLLLGFRSAGFFSLNISRNRELLFMVTERIPYERDLRAFGEKMRRSIRRELGCDSTVLIGTTSQNGEELSNVYRKFDILEENRFFLKEGDVIVDSASYTQKGSVDENVETVLVKVYEDIRFREFRKAAEGIDKAVRLMEQEGSMSNIYVRHIFIEILSRLSQYSDVMTNSESMEEAKLILTVPDIWTIEESVLAILEKAEKKQKSSYANDSVMVVDKVVAIIRSEYGNPSLTTEYIARKVFLSPNYLSAMFRRVKGESINGFIRNYRLDRARELLKDSNIKVRDIAGLVGFASDGYFATVFKKAEGMSAIEYRKQNSKRY